MIMLDSLHMALGSGFVAFVGGLAVKIYDTKKFVRKEECVSCNDILRELTIDVKVLRELLRIALEKQGMSSTQQLRIEAEAKRALNG